MAVWTLCLGRWNDRKNESAVYAANNPYFTALVDVVGYGLVIMEKASTAIQGIHAWVKFIPDCGRRESDCEEIFDKFQNIQLSIGFRLSL